MNAPMTIEAGAPAEESPRRRFALPKKAWKIGLVAAVVAALGSWWILSPRSAESTDNAYLQADASEVAPRVGGLVTAVLVQDNQAVRAGDPLVRIDVRDYDSRLMAASRDEASVLSGMRTGTTPTALPASAVPASRRALTGTDTTKVCRGSRRRRRSCPTAPLTATSTSSLSVTPSRDAPARTAARSASTTSTRRRAPVGRTRLVRPASLSRATPSSRAPPGRPPRA